MSKKSAKKGEKKHQELLKLQEVNRFLLPCTQKFISKELAQLQEQFKNDPDNYALQRKISLYSKLLATKGVYTPNGNCSKVGFGTGVEMLAGGVVIRKIIDSTCLGRCDSIISLDSPLGKLLHGKGVGDSVEFTTQNGKEIKTFKILKIFPYQQAKKILKDGGIELCECGEIPAQT